MPNALWSYGFPDNYYNNLVASASAVKYVSTSGSNSNNGNSIATAYKTIAYAISANSATATSITIVILPGTYVEVPITAGSSYATTVLTDGNTPRVFVCAPGQVKIQFSDASMSYGPYIANFQNSGTAVYGAIFERNNGGRSTNYMVALFCGSSTVGNLEGNFYNCGFTEVNANNSWALLYDNEGAITSQLNNCTFKFGAGPQADYNGGGGMTITSSVFNTAAPTGNSLKVSTLASQSVSATYVTTGVTTAGVYSGTYAWNGTITPPPSTAVVSATTGSPSTSFFAEGAANYKYYAFTSSGTITFSSGGLIDILTVAGGGSGSAGVLGGGGGAGGLLTSTSITVSAAAYTITVGAGGASASDFGNNGSNSVVSGTGVSITAIGGGAGGVYGTNSQPGQNGGSGGGGSYFPTVTAGVGVYPSSTYLSQTRQGYDGGVGKNFTTGAGTGGGGGAGAKGGDSGANDPGPSGAGGTGLQLNYNGSNVYYAGGGGGGGYNAGGDIGGNGGLGGGGGGKGVVLGTSDTTRGAVAPTSSTGGSAGVNTGGGGGGSGGGTSGAGGSGIVIVRYIAQPLGLFASANVVVAGSNATFTLYSENTGNIPYTITGVTSSQVSTALTGNISVANGSGSLSIATISTIAASYTISLTADGFTSNITLSPNVSMTAPVMLGTFYSSIPNPLPGQLNIPHIGANAISDPTLHSSSVTKTILSSSYLANKVIVPTVTTTTKTNGPLTVYVAKPMGDNPNREYWM